MPTKVPFCVYVCLRQLWVVSGRTVLNSLRNPQTSYAQLGLNIFFAILVGLIYYQMPLTLPEALQNRYSTHNLQHNSRQFSLSSFLSHLLSLYDVSPFLKVKLQQQNVMKMQEKATGFSLLFREFDFLLLMFGRKV